MLYQVVTADKNLIKCFLDGMPTDRNGTM